MLASAVRGFDRLLELGSMVLLTVLLGVVSAGILFRAANHPLGFTDEASGYLMVWLACFGWMLATRRGAHIRIRYFVERMPGMARRGTELVTDATAILVGLVIAFKALHVIETNLDVEATTMPVSAALLFLPLVPAGLVTAAQGLADLVTNWRAPREITT